MDPPTTSIDDLPPEMISELFEYLPLKDLAACSLVNKRWHSIFVSFKLHGLAVFDCHPFSSAPRMWFNSKQPIRETQRCDPAMFRRLEEKPLLSNLKQLALYGWTLNFELNKLGHRFPQLMHLQIKVNYLVENVNLNLPRLKVLALHFGDTSSPLSIDCPLLSTLSYNAWRGDANRLEVKHPETIRKLLMELVGQQLAPFKNIECLVTRQFETISKATLLSLSRLRELRYNVNIESAFWTEAHNGAGTADRLKRKLSEFLDEAKKLRGGDFRFTFAGFQLTKTMLEQIDFGVQVNARGEECVSNEYVYMKNYHLIEPDALHFVYRIDYNGLLSHSTGEFPCCFSQKFTDIQWVEATAKVQDADHFLSFLKSLRSLRRLELTNTGLGQKFYDQLPATAPSLTILYLGDGHCKDELQLNFDFIDKLSHLFDLSIEPELSLDSFLFLVRWLDKLAAGYFCVQSKEELYEITRDVAGPSEWRISKYQEVFEAVFESENSDEIANFFKTLQDETPERSAASD